jgi:hypothetical protein
MTDKSTDLDVEARLRGFLEVELQRATADFAPRPLRHASTARSVALVIPSVVAVLVGVVVVVSRLINPAPVLVGGTGTVGPSGSPPATTSPASPTVSPTASPALAYPDGLPMELDGEHVYRANDPIVVAGGAEILVTGWVVGWIVPSCVPNPSPPPGYCPRDVQLADSPGGPTVLVVRWPSSSPGAAVVVRINPADQGCGDGEQSCIAPFVVGTGVLWVGPPDHANPGGTCSAGQFVVGTPLDGGPGFGAMGTSDDFVTVPLHDVGGDCVLNLPAAINVASANVPFQAVKVLNAGVVTAFSVSADGNVSIVLGDSWPLHPAASGEGALNSCGRAITDATRVEIPFASGSLQIDLGTVWPEVCPDPPSVSMTFITK